MQLSRGPLVKTPTVELSVVYLDFHTLRRPPAEALDRVAAIRDSGEAGPCVWTDATVGLVHVCLDVSESDLWLASEAAARELVSAMVDAGVAGELRKVTACNEREQLTVNGADLRRLHYRVGQTYCDWCSGPLTAASIAESERLGLGSERAWACASCLASGAHRAAPDGWDPEEFWPSLSSE